MKEKKYITTIKREERQGKKKERKREKQTNKQKKQTLCFVDY
jgi:hypothetical protein